MLLQEAGFGISPTVLITSVYSMAGKMKSFAYTYNLILPSKIIRDSLLFIFYKEGSRALDSNNFLEVTQLIKVELGLEPRADLKAQALRSHFPSPH